jgi:exodeoxyribonuclease-3
MKLATWNVNSLKVRLPQLLTWLAREQPDVVCLQETKLEDHGFPRQEIEAAGYHVSFSGQKTYNGVALLAREGRRKSWSATRFTQMNRSAC